MGVPNRPVRHMLHGSQVGQTTSGSGLDSLPIICTVLCPLLLPYLVIPMITGTQFKHTLLDCRKGWKDLKVTDLCSPSIQTHSSWAVAGWGWIQSPNPLTQVRATLRFALHFRIQESGLKLSCTGHFRSVPVGFLSFPVLPTSAASVPGEEFYSWSVTHAFGSPSASGQRAPRLVQFQTLGNLDAFMKQSSPLS